MCWNTFKVKAHWEYYFASYRLLASVFNFPLIFKYHPTYNVQWSVKKRNTSFLCN